MVVLAAVDRDRANSRSLRSVALDVLATADSAVPSVMAQGRPCARTVQMG